MKALYITNTLTRQKELFKPVNPGHVGMYVCGPTVYGDAHLGHARPAITFDVLFRYLQELGYDIQAFATAPLDHPEFTQTVFASVKNIRIGSNGKNVAEADMNSFDDFNKYLIKRDTRHFAKKQLTWFKREKEVIWIDKSLYHDKSVILENMIRF